MNPRGLWPQFLLLLLAVTLLSLSAAFVLRELMLTDFREYLEGEMEDRVYWITADLEGSYGRFGEWRQDVLAEDAIRALMLGLEVRVTDMRDRIVMDSARALESLPPLMRKRIPAVSDPATREKDDKIFTYPLFYEGREIGNLEVRFLRPKKERTFVERSNLFLLLSLLVLGGGAVMLSVVVSRRLTMPLRKLSEAAKALSEGDFASRVSVRGADEIGRLSEAFNRMAGALETQESIRKKLISNVAHELRTPITAMRAELEGMTDGVIPTDREQVRSLTEEIGRLAKIVEAIEELTRAQASALSLNRRTFGLKSFLRTILDRHDPLFQDKGVKLELECNDALKVNADPDRLSQIIINLLSNALKATGPGGTVKVGASKGKEGVMITIADTGTGIPSADLPFVFERFYRTGSGGLGIGLAIVRELVHAHGASIDVASEVGKGTTFTMTFPDLHNSS